VYTCFDYELQTVAGRTDEIKNILNNLPDEDELKG
jgi:hypothetical protein